MKIHNVSVDNRNFIIQIGNNAKENWILIDNADSFDLWFHLDDKPSGHVIVKEILNKNNLENSSNDYKNKYYGFPYELVIMAGEYCKMQSKFKNTKNKIIYTLVQNIKKGRDIGSVIVENSKNIFL
jgi:hypothetical protein